jgi:hypothetical protein
MKFAIVLFAFLLSVPAARGQDHTTSGLDSLGRQLAAFRAMPVGDPSPTPVPCPSDSLLHGYISLDRQELYRRLGQPDWVDPWTFRHWYSLTHPISSNWRGGGHCSIGFLFDDKGVVEDVSVSIAM